MRHATALLIKFAMTLFMLFIVLGLFFRVSFVDIFWTSIVLTIAAYIVGDLLILPLLGNLSATIADFGLVFLGVWIIGAYLFNMDVPLVTAALVSAVAIAAGEWFFHRYMKERVLQERAR